jgi:hypothetical protein
MLTERTMVGPLVADELDALALEGAAGVVEIDGSPGGTIYLDGGCITFAESSGVPDLAVRLVGSRRLSGEQWSRLAEESHPYTGVGALLTERGFISEDDLQSLLRSAVLDALTALMTPSAGEPRVTRIRFSPLAWHWAGTMFRIDVGSARAEVARKAERLARFGVAPEARPGLTDLRHAWAVVSWEQWLLAGKIDGAATIWDLAWQNGLALHDTIEWVGEMVGEGLCTLLGRADSAWPEPDAGQPVRAHRPGAAKVPQSQAAVPASSGLPVGGSPPLPRRKRMAIPGRPVPQAHRARGSAEPEKAGPPHPDLLRQLLDGLKRMK